MTTECTRRWRCLLGCAGRDARPPSRGPPSPSPARSSPSPMRPSRHRHPHHPVLVLIGFAIIFATALVQLVAPRAEWIKIEESLAPVSAILIVGLGPERITTPWLLWLVAVACGVLARGGRVFWIGRAMLLASLALPIVRHGHDHPHLRRRLPGGDHAAAGVRARDPGAAGDARQGAPRRRSRRPHRGAQPSRVSPGAGRLPGRRLRRRGLPARPRQLRRHQQVRRPRRRRRRPAAGGRAPDAGGR